MFAQLDSKGEKHDYSGDPSGRPALSTTQIAVIFCEASNLTKEVIARGDRVYRITRARPLFE
jgi:hypothetical protein